MSQRHTIYNPRFRRWEYEDGTPVDGEKPKAGLVNRAFVKSWTEKGLSFGEYAEIPLADVPSDYLREVRTTNESLAQAIKEELRRRSGDG